MGKWKKSSEKLIEQFHNAMEQFEDIEPRKMFGYPCCFIQGNMFSGLHEENWVLRLSEKDREEMKDLGAKPFEPMGRTMKEYVLIPETIQADQTELKKWIKRSIEFTCTKPPKPTKYGRSRQAV